MCIMCWYQHAFLDAILKVLNGLNVSEVVGPSMGARSCCDKQLLMSVDDRENITHVLGSCGVYQREMSAS